jgi:hypothetical protein
MGDAATLAWYETLQDSNLVFSNFSSTGFPETVDKLDPEIGYIGGPKPIIFGMSHRCTGIQSLTSSYSGI